MRLNFSSSLSLSFISFCDISEICEKQLFFFVSLQAIGTDTIVVFAHNDHHFLFVDADILAPAIPVTITGK